MSLDMLSVGSLIPVTTGIIDGGVLCVLSGKYILCVLIIFGSLINFLHNDQVISLLWSLV